MGHDHHHDDDTYYLDQLSMIAVCGAFAAAAIILYFWQQPILVKMFGEGSMFHDFVVWSGAVLLVLVLVRAVSLWIAAGRVSPVNACGHDHEHHGNDCSHDHGHHHHEHDHGHHHHEHAHDHNHSHDHTHADANCHADHDHGFAPWRYVVLLVPIILFLLGLPNSGPRARAHAVAVTGTDAQMAPAFGALIGVGPLPLPQLVLAAAIEPPAKGMDFKALEAAAQSDENRQWWKGKMVRVVGQYAASPSSDRIFSLVRFRIQCCGADAIAYRIPARCSESLGGLQTNQWVEVTGRVDFQPHPSGGGFMTVLHVPRRQNIVVTNPDPNPYIQ